MFNVTCFNFQTNNCYDDDDDGGKTVEICYSAVYSISPIFILVYTHYIWHFHQMPSCYFSLSLSLSLCLSFCLFVDLYFCLFFLLMSLSICLSLSCYLFPSESFLSCWLSLSCLFLSLCLCPYSSEIGIVLRLGVAVRLL